MSSRARNWLFLLIALIPSAHFAWRNRHMPQFAYLHDDGVQFVSARSLAVEHTYRIPSLPENPAQTKFPVLYPLYLSLVWRLNPHFPDNLPLATALSWLALMVYLGLTWLVYRQWGFSSTRAGWLLILLGVNPYLVLFGSTMFAEVFFTCWVLAALLAASRPGIRMVLLAGLLAGCAYLSRTAGIALLVSVPAWLAWRREWRRAAAFFAAMLPAVIGWSVWTRTHLQPGADDTLAYYTDYLRYQFLNVGFDNIAVVLWKNLFQVLDGMGSLVLPQVIADSAPLRMLTDLIAVAMIAGVVRLVRRSIAADYALFGLVFAGILLIWHFPPNERFVLPLYPLLLAGLATEIEHLWQMLRAGFKHKDRSQRVAAAVFSGAVAVVFGAAAIIQVFVTFFFLTQSADDKAKKLHDLRAAYTWISANLPPSATILSYDDPLMYLYTGHRGNYLPLLPRWWYSQDHAAMVGAYRNLTAYCRSRGLQYVYFTSEDLDRETGDEDRRDIQRVVRENPDLRPVFSAGIGTLYRVAAAR